MRSAIIGLGGMPLAIVGCVMIFCVASFGAETSNGPREAPPLEVDPSENAPAADVYPHAGLPAAAAAKAMTVPEGFSVVVAAEEPDVHQPIALAYDDRGRLWVAEAYSYPVRVESDQARDRILIFEDRDGDGRFDDRKVFADRLNLVSGLEVGFGGVWVGAAPELLFFADRDGDDVPDGPPQVLLDGWGFQDTHETLNGFIWGPDGWLYGCHGVFTHSSVGRPGCSEDQRVPLNAAIWRYHPTRHQFEIFAEGTSNPWGVDFNDHGHAFLTACVIPHLYHVIQGARYERQAGSHFNPYTYNDIKTIADHRHFVGDTWHAKAIKSGSAGGGHAHSGAMIYLGGVWPDRYRNQIFMNNIHGQRLNMDLLDPRGSGYVGRHGPDFLLTGDLASQFVNLRYGPDGQVHVIDWYDRQACHTVEPQRVDRGNGRIYKVIHGKSDPFHGNLQSRTDVQLAQAMLHPNDWHVRHARRILQERKVVQAIDAHAVAVLRDIAFRHADETRRLRALWGLHVIGALEQEADRIAVLKDPHPAVRGWGLQLMAEQPHTLTETLRARWAEMAADDDSPIVRLSLASALQRLPIDQRWDVVVPLSQHAGDAEDHNLPLMIWYACEPLVAADTPRALALGMSAASSIPRLRDYVVRRIADFGTDVARQELLAAMTTTTDVASQRVIVSALRESLGGRHCDPPLNWPQSFAALRTSDDAEVRQQLAALGVLFGDPEAITIMRQAMAEAQADAKFRQLAIESLLGRRDEVLQASLPRLLEDDAVRSVALRAVSDTDDIQAARRVAELTPSWSPSDRRLAIATLGSRANYAELLLRAVQNGQISSADLSADVVRQLRSFQVPAIDQLVAEVWGTMRQSAADKEQLMGEYRRMIGDRRDVLEPDTSLGRAIFSRTCQQCHTLYGTGGKIGPDLTGANRSDHDYLVSNIVDPSAVLAKEYQTTLVETTDGRIISGILRQESPEHIAIQTATDLMTIAHRDIERRELSPKSLMPDDQLKPFSKHEIRSLFAYLSTRHQVPMLATKDHAPPLFNGNDLQGWSGPEGVWSVREGAIIGQTLELTGRDDARNQPRVYLTRDLMAADFRLAVDVLIPNDQADVGVHFRSRRLSSGGVQGYKLDLRTAARGQLQDTGRPERFAAISSERSDPQGPPPIWRSGQWNTATIEAQGAHIRLAINGRTTAEWDDEQGARRGVFALEFDPRQTQEVRFRNLSLELLSNATGVAGVQGASP